MPTSYIDTSALINAFKAGVGADWQPGQVLPNDWTRFLDKLVSGPGEFVTNSLILEELSRGADKDGGIILEDWLRQKLSPVGNIQLHELTEAELAAYRNISNGGELSLIDLTANNSEYTAPIGDQIFIADENLANKPLFTDYGYTDSNWRNNPSVFGEQYNLSHLDSDYAIGADYVRSARGVGLVENQIFGRPLGNGADTFGDLFRKLWHDEMGGSTIPGGQHWDDLSDFVRTSGLRLAGEAVGIAAIAIDAASVRQEFYDALANGDLVRADEILGGLIGRSFGGAFAGAVAGAAGGSVFGPLGTIGGTIVGTILGGIVGALGGDELGRWLFGELGDLGLHVSGIPALFDKLDDLLRDLLADPLVLDLDGDGVELVALASIGTRFDLDHDGYSEKAGWISPQDGFLVHDANGNGIVDGVAELFGNAHVDGFDELALLDDNHDGRIDAADAAFSQLKVWRDLNSDGVSTSDEMLTLAQAGITRFNLGFTEVDTEVAGNVINRNGSFVRTDGSTRTMSSVEFALDDDQPVPTIPDGIDIGDLAVLPNLSGVFGLPDLRTAMFHDSRVARDGRGPRVWRPRF